jgi:hypothetical protein
LAAVIETASNRPAWSFSRIGLAGSALGHARPDTTLICTSAAKGRMLDAVRDVG